MPVTPALRSLLVGIQGGWASPCPRNPPAPAPLSRAAELAEKLADALAHAERLCFICEADARYEQERGR